MRMSLWTALAASSALSVAIAQVPPTWSRISPPLGLQAQVRAIAVFDDGSGPALFAAGAVTHASGMSIATGAVARWNGTAWSGTAAPIDGTVRALATFDDGTGPALYAGGDFAGTGPLTGTHHLMRWNGTSWSALPGAFSGAINAMAVFDDGTGPRLHVAGEFAQIDSQTVGYVARWDGSSWASLGTGVGPILAPGLAGYSAMSLAVHDDGGGPGLFVGGNFQLAGGLAVANVARWRNGQWGALGSGLTGTVDHVKALASAGGALFAGGYFRTAGSLSVNGIARWDGASWSAVGTGFANSVTTGAGQGMTYVAALAGFDGGSGPVLYAGGQIALAGTSDAVAIARWNGTVWTAIGGSIGTDSIKFPEVDALAAISTGGTSSLCIGGRFSRVGAMAASSIASWEGGSWNLMSGGLQGGPGEAIGLNPRLLVREVAAATGRELLVTGDFVWIGTTPCRFVARWNGSAWTALGAGLAAPPSDVAAVTIGGSTSYYAVVESQLWSLDGGTWAPAGTPGDAYLDRIVAFDPGTGPALHGVGTFVTVGGSGLARWNGTAWDALASVPIWQSQARFTSLIQRTDSVGPALFATYDIAWTPYSRQGIALQWSGTALTTLGGFADCDYENIPYLCYGTAESIEVLDDGTGPHVFVSGSFVMGGLNNVARLGTAGWEPLAGGAPGPGRLFAYDSGSGPRLHLDIAGSGITRWNGTAWDVVANTPIGDGVVTATYDDGGGRDIVMSGVCSVGGEPPVAGVFISRSCLDSRVGESVGVPIPVLSMSSQLGWISTRSAFEPLGVPFTIRMLPPVGNADMAVFVMLGEPTPSMLTPSPIGQFCMPPPGPGSPTLWLASSVGNEALLQVPPAPWSWLVPAITSPLVATFQGAIADPTAPAGVSVTNGIVLHVGP